MYVPKKIINYNDYMLLEQYILNIDSLNESTIIENLSKLITNKSDVSKYINIILKKYYDLAPEARKKLINTFLIVATTFFSVSQIYSMIADINIKNDIAEITKTEIVDDYTIDIINAHTSDECKEHIKDEEKLRLTAYNIGDGMITIGYGHAERINKSKYKVGDKISKEKAEILFNNDVKKVEEGIKRIFKQWLDNGIEVKITQGQFDAMVSMAYNMGISKFRQTDFIQELKNSNFEKAARLIPKTAVSDKFSGLYKRRDKEYKMFTEK